MIHYLEGKIIRKTEKQIILLTNGVGYGIHLNENTISQLREAAKLFIHSHIREDSFELYGFLNGDELDFFKTLLNINGIGPKVALEILNKPLQDVKAAVFSADTDFFKRIPGIGAKTAQRIILELKGKIEFIEEINQSSSNHRDAIDGLKQLGYKTPQINAGLKNMPEHIESAEEIITYFLQNVSS